MRNKFVYKAASLILLAGLLASCGQKTPQLTNGDDHTPMGNEEAENKVEITVNRTPTPVLDPEDIPINVTPSRPGPGQPDQPDTPAASLIRGEGEKLDGYTQLLYYIDRENLWGPAGWGNHPLGDMFDGLFESTNEGSNKYGHGDATPFEVSWKMEKSVCVSAYTLYTANDSQEYPDRNPNKWEFYGSEDGENWTLLQKMDNAQLPAQNYVAKTFYLDNTQAYRYYKWVVQETIGGGFQLSEMLLYTAEDIPEKPPVAPPVGVGEFEGSLPVKGLAAQGKDAEPIIGEDAAKWMQDHVLLNEETNILSAYISVSCFADQEGPAQLFDADFDGSYSADDIVEHSGGKLGCGIPEGAYLVFQTEKAIAPTAYVFVTGNDTDFYPERNPVQWVLYGSTDGENWVALDQVSNGNMVGDNYIPHVYTMENTEKYNWFCFSVENTGTLQLQELMIFQ